ncbi:hypothetical protein [Sphingopyxis solisilvae]
MTSYFSDVEDFKKVMPKNLVIASEAKQSRVAHVALDCFASLAMTEMKGD